MHRRAFLTCALCAAVAHPLAAHASAPASIGLILVGQSWCSACKGAAATLHAALAQTPLPFLVASQDGAPIAPFADYVDARGHPIAMGITTVPVLLFVHTPTQDIIARIDGYTTPRRYLGQIRATLLAAKEAGYV